MNNDEDSDERATDDAETTDSEATSDEEDREERTTLGKQDARGRNAGKRRQDSGGESSAAETRRQPTKHERTSLSARGQYNSDDEVLDTNVPRNRRRERRNRVSSPHSNFTIKDVESSLSYFSGEDKLPIESWITEFEDMSALLEWSDLQKLVYSKRMLKESAKQFVYFERGIISWSTLKRWLKREFKVRLNSATVRKSALQAKVPTEREQQTICLRHVGNSQSGSNRGRCSNPIYNRCRAR